MFIPVTLDLWVQQAIQVHDPPRPALHRFVRVALLLPPHAPHTVNLQHFQLPHNVCVRPGVEVHEAAVGATKDELEARSKKKVRMMDELQTLSTTNTNKKATRLEQKEQEH